MREVAVFELTVYAYDTGPPNLVATGYTYIAAVETSAISLIKTADRSNAQMNGYNLQLIIPDFATEAGIDSGDCTSSACPLFPLLLGEWTAIGCVVSDVKLDQSYAGFTSIPEVGPRPELLAY